MNSQQSRFSHSRLFPQIRSNLICKFISTVTALLTGIWLTPYLISHLGIAAYGMLPLATALTLYSSFISQGISAAITRFITVELHKPGGSPAVIFNSALFLYFSIVLIQIPLFALLFFKRDLFINIPGTIYTDASILILCSAAGYLISLISGVFGVSVFAKNRLDVTEGTAAFTKAARLVLIIGAFYWLGPALRFIGYIDLVLSIVTLFVYIFSWKKLSPELTISLKAVKLPSLLPLFSMSFWIILNNLGILFHTKSTVWIANKLLSPDAAGQFGALSQLTSLFYLFASNLTIITSPLILSLVGQEAHEKAIRITTFSLKVLAIGMAIPCSLFVIYSPEILQLWLGTTYRSLWPHLSILMIPNFFIATPAAQYSTAQYKVKVPALTSISMGLIHIALSVLGVYLFKVDLQFICISLTITLIIKNLIILPYISRCEGLPLSQFLIPYKYPVLLFIIILILSAGLHFLFPSGSTLTITIHSLFIMLFSTLFAWFFLFTIQEKKVFTQLLKR